MQPRGGTRIGKWENYHPYMIVLLELGRTSRRGWRGRMKLVPFRAPNSWHVSTEHSQISLCSSPGSGGGEGKVCLSENGVQVYIQHLKPTFHTLLTVPKDLHFRIFKFRKTLLSAKITIFLKIDIQKSEICSKKLSL